MQDKQAYPKLFDFPNSKISEFEILRALLQYFPTEFVMECVWTDSQPRKFCGPDDDNVGFFVAVTFYLL